MDTVIQVLSEVFIVTVLVCSTFAVMLGSAGLVGLIIKIFFNKDE